jgi:hypothetical protein
MILPVMVIEYHADMWYERTWSLIHRARALPIDSNQKGNEMSMPLAFGSDRARPARVLCVIVGLLILSAVLVLANPFGGRAFAETPSIVFPLEKRASVYRGFMAPRSGHLHQGIDLMAPKMTKEVAAVSGTVTLQVRMRDGLPGTRCGWPGMMAAATTTRTSTTTLRGPTTAKEGSSTRSLRAS